MTFSAPQTKLSAVSSHDALRMALGEVIAAERREWRREREVIEAQARATIAELRAEVLALRGQVEAMVSERLASLRDGVDGKDGADGRNGADAPEISDDRINAAVVRHFAENPIQAPRDGRDGADGKDGRDGADADPAVIRQMVHDAVAEVVAAFPAPRDGIDGKDGRDGADGKDGAPGKLGKVTAWEDRVHYDGEVVTYGGAIWQARRDTGREPGHEDWLCIVAAGRDGQNGADGRSFTVRGTWAPDAEYRGLDVVMLGGSSFVARHDDPGACPGEGWQLLASHGSRGKPGERGAQGLRGPAGPALQDAEVDEFGVVTLRNADGSATTVDLYPVLAKLAR